MSFVCPSSISVLFFLLVVVLLLLSLSMASIFSPTGKGDEDDHDNRGIDWVIHYVFDNVGLLICCPSLPRMSSCLLTVM